MLHNSMLQSCKKILIEFKNVRDIFPMNNMIEGVNFRQFKLGDRVDARDQAGKWHDAEVVDVIYESVIMGTGGVAYKQRHYNSKHVFLYYINVLQRRHLRTQRNDRRLI